jgi:hypothetical protein
MQTAHHIHAVPSALETQALRITSGQWCENLPQYLGDPPKYRGRVVTLEVADARNGCVSSVLGRCWDLLDVVIGLHKTNGGNRHDGVTE